MATLAIIQRLGVQAWPFAGAALTTKTYLASPVAAGLHLVLAQPAALSARLRGAAVAGWWIAGQAPVRPDHGVARNLLDPLMLPLVGWPHRLLGLAHFQPPTLPDVLGQVGAPLVAVWPLLIAAGIVLACAAGG